MEYAGMEDYMSEPTDPVKSFRERAVDGLENRSILKSRLIDTCEGMRRRIVEEAKRIAELL